MTGAQGVWELWSDGRTPVWDVNWHNSFLLQNETPSHKKTICLCSWIFILDLCRRENQPNEYNRAVIFLINTAGSWSLPGLVPKWMGGLSMTHRGALTADYRNTAVLTAHVRAATMCVCVFLSQENYASTYELQFFISTRYVCVSLNTHSLALCWLNEGLPWRFLLLSTHSLSQRCPCNIKNLPPLPARWQGWRYAFNPVCETSLCPSNNISRNLGCEIWSKYWGFYFCCLSAGQAIRAD